MTKKPSKPRKSISEKQRASDEKLREELRHFDLKKFDKAMEKLMKPQPGKGEGETER